MLPRPKKARLVIRVDAPRSLGGRAHPEWTRLLRTLRLVGLASDVADMELTAMLGGRAASPPDPATVHGFLAHYYRGSRVRELAYIRMRRDRVVAADPTDPFIANGFVAKVLLAAPELGWLCFEEHEEHFSLRAGDHRVPLGTVEEETLPSEDGHYHRFTVTLREIMAAVNRLLDTKGVKERFVPLCGSEEGEVFAMLTAEQAEALGTVHLLAASLERIMIFAHWAEDPNGAAQLASSESYRKEVA